jgi:hypothetical protein
MSDFLPAFFATILYNPEKLKGHEDMKLYNTMDADIKQMFTIELFGFALDKPQNIQSVIQYCKSTIEDHPCEFTVKNLRETYQRSTLAVLAKWYSSPKYEHSLEEQNLNLFLNALFKVNYITASNILNVWIYLCELSNTNEIVLPKLMKLILTQKKFVKKLEDIQLPTALAIRDFTKLQQENSSLTDCQKDFADVLKYLNELTKKGQTANSKESKEKVEQLNNIQPANYKEKRKNQTDQLQLNNIQPSTSKQALKETTPEAKPNQSEKALKLSIFNENELKIIQRKVGELAKSERMKTIIKTLKQENVNAKQSEIRQVLEMFIEIAIQCLEKNQVKVYVEHVLNNIRGFIDSELLNKFLKSIIFGRFDEIKEENKFNNLITITAELHKKSKLSTETIMKILSILLNITVHQKMILNVLNFVKQFASSLVWKNISQNSQITLWKDIAAVRSHLNNGTMQGTKEDIKEIFFLLKIPLYLEHQQEQMVEDSESVLIGKEGVNVYFEEFVRKINNDENLKGPMILICDEQEARYFLKNASKDESSAIKFSHVLNESRKKPNLTWLRERVFALCEEKFLKQHNPKKQRDFAKEDIEGTNCLVVILFQFKLITSKKVEQFSNYIWNTPNYTELSANCAVFLMNALKAFYGNLRLDGRT